MRSLISLIVESIDGKRNNHQKINGYCTRLDIGSVCIELRDEAPALKSSGLDLEVLDIADACLLYL